MKHYLLTILLPVLWAVSSCGESSEASPQNSTENTEVAPDDRNYERLEAELLAKTKEQLASIEIGMTRREFENVVGRDWELGITATWSSVQRATYNNRKLPNHRLKVDFAWVGSKGVFQRRFTPDDPIVRAPELKHAPSKETDEQLALLNAVPVFGHHRRGSALIRKGDLDGATAVYREAIAVAEKRLDPKAKSADELHTICMLAGKAVQYIDEGGGPEMAQLLCDDVLRGLRHCREVVPHYKPEQLANDLQQMDALRIRLREEAKVP